MRDYKRKYQAEYMSLDTKPKGKMKKKIQASVRQKGKKLIKQGLEEPSKEEYKQEAEALPTTMEEELMAIWEGELSEESNKSKA